VSEKKKMYFSAFALFVFNVVAVVVANGESLREKVGLQAEALRLNRDHSLILIPVVKGHDVRRRSTNDIFDASESDKHQKKYQRLAHSVHVQSDIRYR
jgi:hypothetical protein